MPEAGADARPITTELRLRRASAAPGNTGAGQKRSGLYRRVERRRA